MVTASERKMLAKEVVKQNRITVSQAYRTFFVSETCYRYEPILISENQIIEAHLIELTQRQRNWGLGLCFLYLRNVKGLTVDVDFSLPAERVIRSLNQIIQWRGKPKSIRCDNGPEYISHLLSSWAKNNDITLCFIQPGNPQQNAYIERFNRTVRYDWLSHYIYSDITELQDKATRWLWTYNHERPNMRIGGITPIQKLKLIQQQNFMPNFH